MSRYYLGIDTSNYRTSAALYDAETKLWKNESRLLSVPEGAIGLRQSDALFQHTVSLHERITALSEGADIQLCGIGVSTRPRAVPGSYMPCFLAGENVARSIAGLFHIPLYPCSHQQGHLAAAALSADVLSWLKQPFLAWHLSGGTTELLRVAPSADGLLDAQQIGGTTDLTAGQLIDRTGQALGLAFPAGAALDQIAMQAQKILPSFSPKVKDGYFSLSGVENQVKKLVAHEEPADSVARFVIETIANAVQKTTAQVLLQYPMPLICAGGVMASKLIRSSMQVQFSAHFAEPTLSGDNAVGTAVLAALQREIS